LAIDKAAARRAIQVLESKGLVTSNPIDGRQCFLSVTEKGRALHDRVLSVALERERILLSSLTTAERKQTLVLLQKLGTTIPALNDHEPIRHPASRSERR
jgi:DNA-binding MarR family transcriptional regulator